MQSKADLKLQYKDELAAITPFAQLNMGLKTEQSYLKIEKYNIICAPYRISLSGATLLGAFSKEEQSFFQRFTNSLSGLSLAFQAANNPNPIKIFARCFIKAINPMKGRENFGLIEVVFKPCPPDLEAILIDYFMLLDKLKVEYNDFSAKAIPINSQSSSIMGFNNYALMAYAGDQSKVAIFSIASDSIEFLVPMNGPILDQGKTLTVKLFFKSSQFSVTCTITELARLQHGIQKVKAMLQFSPELVSIIEKYRINELLHRQKNIELKVSGQA